MLTLTLGMGLLPIGLAEIVADIGRHCLAAITTRFDHVHAAILTRLIMATLFLVLIVKLILVLLAAATGD